MNYLWGGMILAGIIYGAFNGTMQDVVDAALSSSREAVTLCITMMGVMALWTGIMKIAEESGIVAGLTRALAPLVRFMFPNIPEDHPARRHISMNVIANVLGLGWAATPAGLKAMESLAELEEERRAEEDAQASDGYQTEDESASARRKEGRYVQRTAAAWQIANTVQASDRYRAKEKHVGKTAMAWRTAGAERTADTRRGRKTYAVPRGTASNEMCTFLILNISSLQLIPVNIIAYRAQYGSVNPTAVVGPGIAATAVSTLAAVAFCKVMGRK